MSKTQLLFDSNLIEEKTKNSQENLKKRNLGQFFTTNCDYILQGFEEFVKGKKITDPFAGNQDLLKLLRIIMRKQKLLINIIRN
jgi:hypothetical protein